MSGSNTCVLPVTSTAKKVAVSGERIVPPMIAAIASSAQKPGLAAGSTAVSTAPKPPPMISKGARTPPEVPEPSATAQISAFTTISCRPDSGDIVPCSICAMLA
jgi:hypothetical protein